VITSNVICRVFRVRYSGSEGTAFAVDVDARQYLVTARHVVAQAVGAFSLDVFTARGWQNRAARLVGHATGEPDISVLALDSLLTPGTLPMEATSDSIVFGQDAYFLGFPYGWVGSLAIGKEGFPLPFVKRATVSHFDKTLFLLDGHNNPGFSGGPVVFTERGKLDFRVAAVVSGYRAAGQPVLVGGVPARDAGGQSIQVMANTGFIESWGIKHAVDIIKSNPVGVPL
jgi:S1-C subfamily serine protease